MCLHQRRYMRTTIRRWGNSAAVRLSRKELDRLGLREGDDVEVEVRPSKARRWDVSMVPAFKGPKDGRTFKEIRERAFDELWEQRRAGR